jgi:hypothetical protein
MIHCYRSPVFRRLAPDLRQAINACEQSMRDIALWPVLPRWRTTARRIFGIRPTISSSSEVIDDSYAPHNKFRLFRPDFDQIILVIKLLVH